MKREVAAEIVDSLKKAGVDFVATLTEANLHDLVMALGEHPGIPVLMLIGHSGGVGEENAGHATVGSLTEPVLQAMHIVYEKVGRFDDIRPTIHDSQILARSSRRPTAIVLNKQALR